MRKKAFEKILCFVALTGLLLMGCGTANKNENSEAVQSSKSSVENNNQEAAQNTVSESDETNKEKSKLVVNDTGKTIISKANTDCMYNTTYMIISKDGTVILTDPIQMIEGIEADIITVTHGHSDHDDGSVVGKADSRKSSSKLESFTHKEVKVTSVASAHGDYEVNEEYPDNVIYILEVDGLRIAHMGDIGQKELTAKQMKALGKLDVAFMPCVDLPEYGLTMENSIKVLQQLKPQIVIPTHFDPSNYEGVLKLEKTFDETKRESFKYAISKEDLNDGKRVFMRLN